MSDINLVVRYQGGLHKAEVTVADTLTCADIIQAAVKNWELPADKDYSIANVTKVPPVTLNPSETLAASGVAAGDTLEIQPILVAGR